jgi:hypothetical protein
MEFHLPFFALRKTPPPGSSPLRAYRKRLRKMKDLSFLRGENTDLEDQESYCIYQAQISYVVWGLDEWQWIVYAFVDTKHNDGDGDGNGDDSVDKATSSKGLSEDPITCGLDTSLPIWKPRQYFLKAFEIRAKEVRQEWDQLIRRLVLDISEYVCCVTLEFYIALINIAFGSGS